MVHKQETAEERLLRMIEGPQSGAPAETQGRPASPLRWIRQRGRSLAALVWLRWGFPSARPGREDMVLQHLQLVSRLMWLLLIAFAGYVAVQLARPAPQPRAWRSEEPVMAEPADAPQDAAPLEEKPLADYVAAVVQRNPFTGTAESVSTRAAVVEQTSKQRLEEIAAKLVVVGIDRGDVPEALVEDTAQQRTYFVKVGDTINGLTVAEIDDRGVTVTYDGEDLLLR